MADRLRVTELDFDTIKTNLKEFLKQQSQFTDYDFDGSGLSILLDILAYNTHYNAYYLNMVANESFLDTALLRDSVVSHAKTLGYIPFSSTAPRAVINFQVNSSSPTISNLTIPRGYQFFSEQIDGVSYNFIVLEDITVTKANSNYYFQNLEIYEGQFVTNRFIYDQSTNPKQIFTLPDENIDTSTLKVTASPSAVSTSLETYNQVQDILDVTTDSKVYFLQESRSGQYEIYFGNGSVGAKLPDGAVVNTSYLVTNGGDANKANNFVGSSVLSDLLSESLSNFVVTPVSPAAGGASRETIDSIKFSSISQYSTQNRLVTTSDYESYIKKKYPAIESISVWGGEDNIPPVYGKVFMSLKPRNDYYISELEKQKILNEIVNPKNIVSVSAEIIDPQYLYILVGVEVQYDPKKTTNTSEALKSAIRNAILNYRNINLNKFASKIVDSKLEYAIDSVDTNAIVGNELTVRVQKRFTPILNSLQSYKIDFNVPLHRGTTTNKLKSTEFSVIDGSGAERTVIIEEVPQSITGISQIDVVDPGLGYTSTPTVTITGDGAGAVATAVVVGGRIESIQILNRGYDYTKAVVTITGGGGQSASAVAVVDNRIGTLRTIYFDSNAERKIVNSNVGSIDYNSGQISINDIEITSVSSLDGQIRIDIEAEEGIIESLRNTIITIDENDLNSIQINLKQI